MFGRRLSVNMCLVNIEASKIVSEFGFKLNVYDNSESDPLVIIDHFHLKSLPVS